MNRQKALLSALLILFAMAILYSYWKMPREKTVKTLTYRPGAAASVKKPPTPTLPETMRVRLDLLNNKQPEFNGFRKNIFSTVVQDGRRTGKRSKVRHSSLHTPPPVAVPTPPTPPPAPQPSPIQQDLAQFTFLGFLKKDNRKTIFLTAGSELFVVKKGDTILGKYQVADINDEMLSIRSLQSGNGGNIVIPLVENRPLSVAGQ